MNKSPAWILALILLIHIASFSLEETPTIVEFDEPSYEDTSSAYGRNNSTGGNNSGGNNTGGNNTGGNNTSISMVNINWIDIITNSGGEANISVESSGNWTAYWGITNTNSAPSFPSWSYTNGWWNASASGGLGTTTGNGNFTWTFEDMDGWGALAPPSCNILMIALFDGNPGSASAQSTPATGYPVSIDYQTFELGNITAVDCNWDNSWTGNNNSGNNTGGNNTGGNNSEWIDFSLWNQTNPIPSGLCCVEGAIEVGDLTPSLTYYTGLLVYSDDGTFMWNHSYLATRTFTDYDTSNGVYLDHDIPLTDSSYFGDCYYAVAQLYQGSQLITETLYEFSWNGTTCNYHYNNNSGNNTGGNNTGGNNTGGNNTGCPGLAPSGIDGFIGIENVSLTYAQGDMVDAWVDLCWSPYLGNTSIWYTVWLNNSNGFTIQNWGLQGSTWFPSWVQGIDYGGGHWEFPLRHLPVSGSWNLSIDSLAPGETYCFEGNLKVFDTLIGAFIWVDDATPMCFSVPQNNNTGGNNTGGNNTGGNNTGGTNSTANTAPQISSVVISPSPSLETDVLTCSYMFNDADNDPDASIFVWTINGITITSVNSVLSSGYIAGDFVTCAVLAYDGIDYGNMGTSTVLIMSNTTISSSNSSGSGIPSVGVVGTLAVIGLSFIAVIRRGRED